MINRTAIACLVSAAVAGGGAWSWQANRYGSELSNMRSAQADVDRLRALATARVIQDAQVRGDKLTSDLLTSEAAITKLSKEKRDVLSRLTTGRPCLSADAVRVLNDDPDGVGVPPAPGSAAATGGAAATDEDVGQWVIAARDQYATCRDRLAALIDWHTKN